jgi:hypothetical protein
MCRYARRIAFTSTPPHMRGRVRRDPEFWRGSSIALRASRQLKWAGPLTPGRDNCPLLLSGSTISVGGCLLLRRIARLALRAVSLDPDVIAAVRDAVVRHHSWNSIGSELLTSDAQRGDSRLRPFVIAFSYSLHERFGPSGERTDGPFGPQMATDQWGFPPPVGEIPPDYVDAWGQGNAAIEHPAAQARLGDLLWERKVNPDPHLLARAAFDGLIRLADDEQWGTISRVQCLTRALELAQETRDTQREAQAVRLLLTFAGRDLDADDGAAGIAMCALHPLVEMSVTSRPGGPDELLRRVDMKYTAAVPLVADQVVEMRIKLLDSDGRLGLRREQVQRMRGEADATGGVLRLHILERALLIAHTYHLHTEADELRQELGRMRPQDLHMREVGAEVSMSLAEIESFLKEFERTGTWEGTLIAIAQHGPPGGSPEQLQAAVEQMMHDHPLQFLFGKAVIDHENATSIYRASTPEEHKRAAAATLRTQHAHVWGFFCALALRRVGEREDCPNLGQLADFFTNDFIEHDVARRIARAIELFWAEQYDESAHVITPRIERVLREMARKIVSR